MEVGTPRYHYQNKHLGYAMWANRWLRLLAVFVLTAIAILYLLGANAGTFVRALLVTYFFGGLIAIPAYRFFIEHMSKEEWVNRSTTLSEDRPDPLRSSAAEP
jgi:glucose-6-phosphate-specific signal transduction histidine kinase